ncbi:hypothetical protein BDW02DRAFT_573809 [Decorospora gaudefroyi]|uniref:Uncharacterized protein n=1 Tax=Decorospora gaudefroyi TaxID=184978 RepID=A0A6A5K5E7_9PLEO|nr:hypothetical protein BDW02DRAFT_573809 [Decorospora gaudefroyi]
MAESQTQSTTKTQTPTLAPQPQQQSAESQSQSTAERQAATSEPPAPQCVSLWATGGHLNVDVGNGEYVRVPNTHGREPTREEIYHALVAAGHHERADEHANRAYGNVSGTL